MCVAVVKRRHVDIREVEGKSSRDQNNNRGTDSEISKQRGSGVARASRGRRACGGSSSGCAVGRGRGRLGAGNDGARLCKYARCSSRISG